MMNILELHEMLHRQPKMGAEFKPPVGQNIDFPKAENVLDQEAGAPLTINPTVKPLPWGKILIWGGGIALGLYLLKKFPKNENYQSRFARRRNRTQGS